MNRFRTLVILIAVPTFALPAPAGWFDRRPKPIPAQRVPQLVGQVKTDPDERKRTAAADELRQYDPRSFPEIVPVLIDVLQNDSASGVRLQALHSLSSFRPVSQEVGEALERAMANDKSMRIRLQARTTLVSYHWSGYHGARRVDGQAPPAVIVGAQPRFTEPPLADEPLPAASPSTGSAPPVIDAPVMREARPLPMGNGANPAPPSTPLPPPDQGPELAPPF